MLHFTFPYVEVFHCIAGACPDSCCKDWEIVIDPETLQCYQDCPEPLGSTLRKVLTKNEDAEWIFQNRENGACPFWNTEGLCQLQLQNKPELLCDTCQQFPRIPQDYTIFTEHVLSLACPEAARLVLTQKEPFEAVFSHSEETPPLSEEDLPYELDWMACLRQTRSVLLQGLQDITIPLSDALCYGLHYVQDLQNWIDEKQDLFPEWQPVKAMPNFLYTEPVQRLPETLQYLTPEWTEQMQQLRQHPLTNAEMQAFQKIAEPLLPAFRNFCSYYLYLFWLQALPDGQVLLQYQKLLVALQEIARVSANWLRRNGKYGIEDCIWIVQQYAKEVLHDAENMEQIEFALSE